MVGKNNFVLDVYRRTKCEGGKIYLNNKSIEQIPIHLRSKGGLGYFSTELFNMSVYDNILGIAQISIKGSENQKLYWETIRWI